MAISILIVANPAFKHRPYVGGVYFVFALFILLWLVLPLVLARLYDFYEDIHVSLPYNNPEANQCV